MAKNNSAETALEQKPAIAGISNDLVALRLRNVVLALTGLLGLVVLIRLVFVRSYNYDELSHAHMAWLVSVGEMPYRDFAANHFPFLWILLSPLMRVLPESPVTLMVLRGLALVCNALFIGALGTLICLELRPRQRIWAAACLGLVVFSPPVMHFLIEFRPDPFANALLFSAIAWLRLSGLRNRSTAFMSGIGIGIAVLLNTKYLLFPFVLGAVALIMYARQARQIWPFAVAIGLGFSASLIAGMLLLDLMHIQLGEAWRMVVTYNATVEKSHTFGFGLVRAIMQNPVWLAYSFVGLIGCTLLFQRQRRLPELLTAAIFIFLAVNLVATTRPWKQYAVSWLLLAAYFPARSLPLLITRLPPQAQAVAAFGFSMIAVVGFLRTGVVDPNGGRVDRQTQDRTIEWMLQRVPPDGFVVSSFQLHPVFRKDTFFKTVFDIARSSTDGLERFRLQLAHTNASNVLRPHFDDGLERFMPQLVPAPYGEHFQLSGYQKDLEIRPPSVIVPQEYTHLQIQALTAYLRQHSNSYDQQEIPGTSVVILERRMESLPDAK